MKKINKVLITGGAGYIGSRLVNRLIEKGVAKVIVVDNLSTGVATNVNKKAKFYKVSILDKKIYSILKKEKPEVIYHLAASKDVNDSLKNPLEFAKTNILGSLNIIDSANRAGIKKIIFASTAGVYGDDMNHRKQKENDQLNPSSPYGWTKLAIEDYLIYMNKNHGMKNIILRFANVYGLKNYSIKSVVNIFLEKLLNKEEINIYGNGKQTRDFIYIDDLIKVFEKLISSDLRSKKQTPIFNVSTGKETSIIKLVGLISKITKTKTKINYKRNIFSGPKRSVLETSKIQKTLNWSASTSLNQGILNTLNVVKNKNI